MPQKMPLVPMRQNGPHARQRKGRARRGRMRLGYFTMPVHPMHRNWAETLKEDREAIILADKLGFYDAFMGEHLTDACENITNSMMFQASLIPETKQIKLATGTSNLSHMHPVLIAVQAAMFDHMAEGRFILGVSARARSPPTPKRSAFWSRTATRCSLRQSTSSWRSGSASRPTTSTSPTTATRSRPRAPCRSISASATWASLTRSRGPRSSARWWRRSRPASC